MVCGFVGLGLGQGRHCIDDDDDGFSFGKTTCAWAVCGPSLFLSLSLLSLSPISPHHRDPNTPRSLLTPFIFFTKCSRDLKACNTHSSFIYSLYLLSLCLTATNSEKFDLQGSPKKFCTFLLHETSSMMTTRPSSSILAFYTRFQVLKTEVEKKKRKVGNVVVFHH
ncbi:hypothetical protein V6Z12_A08G153800 [Gossypium hirsutum]